MACVKNNNNIEVGEWAITTRVIENCHIHFEKGTKVKVVGKSERGYDLMDECGNKITEVSFGSICKA